MKTVLMLLSNAFLPDPRPLAEASILVKAGYQVRILCWDRGEALPREELIDGIAVDRIRLRSTHGRGTFQVVFLSLLWLKMVWRSLRLKFDVIYAHDLDTLPPAVFIKFFMGKKLVFDSHEVYSRMLGDNVRPVLKTITQWLEKKIIKSADCVIVTCEAMGRLYSSYGAKNIMVVGNRKDPQDFKFGKEVVEAEKLSLGIKKELVISYIANLGPERVIKPILDAVKEDPGVFLIVGGDGGQKDLVIKAANSAANIRYLGYVQPEKVRLYTALSDVIYYGYDRNAGMAEFNSPNKLFEALAAGKAFLGGDFGEMGKILNEEECGIALSDFTKDSVKNAIAVFKNSAELKRFKENAKRAGLDKYNWKDTEGLLLKAVSRD